MDYITKNVVKELRPLAELAKSTMLSQIRPLAKKIAALLDECGSEDEFRLQCAAANKDPEEAFRLYGQYVALASGMTELGISRKFGLSDWWAFEKIPGTIKPDPWLSGLSDCLQ